MQRMQRFATGEPVILRFAPPEAGPVALTSPATACSLAVYDDEGTAVVAAGTAATVAIATQINGAVAAGANTIIVDAATSIVPGSWVWIGDPYGDAPPECVQVESIASTTLTLTEDLQYAHADNATVRDAQVTYTWTGATTGRFLARWRYHVSPTAPGSTYATTLFEVAPQPFRLPITAQDLRVAVPQSVRRAAREVMRVADVVAEAEDMLIRDLQRSRINPNYVRNVAQLRGAAVQACVVVLLQRAAMIDGTFRQPWLDAKEAYADELKAFARRPDWLDYDEDYVAATLATTGDIEVDGSFALGR